MYTLLAVAYLGFHFTGINFAQIIYLPGWELVALTVLSISGTTHDNFGDINPFITLGYALAFM